MTSSRLPRPSRGRSARTTGRALVAVVVASALTLAGGVAAHAVESAVPVAPNPALADHCDLNLAISLDLSNSVTDQQLAQARSELAGLADALEGYPVKLAMHTFASNAPATSAASNAPLPLTSLSTDAGVQAFDAYVKGVQRPAQAQGGTNWDRAFAAVTASTESYDALLLVTDGNPTQYGSPAQGPGNSTNQATIDAAVTSANALKGEGVRVIPIGVQDNLSGQPLAEFRQHVAQVSGPTQGSDYYLAGFSGLQSTLLDIVNANCATIDLEKTGTLAAGSLGNVGDTVDYAFTVTNTGAVQLRDVQLSDPKPGLSAITFGTWPGATGTLDPGQSVTAKATYTLTAADVTAGEVGNTATATGLPPAGSRVSDESPALVVLPDPVPAISLDKTGVLTGDTVAYTFVVTNTGTVPLSGVTLTDELPGLSAITFGTWPGATGALAPGQKVTATASYTLTQADRDRGDIANTATATGTPPTGPAVSDEDDVELPVPQAPGISLDKTGVLEGDSIRYSFVVTNTGNVTLTGVTLADELPGISAITFGTWPGATGALAPGQKVTATASYTLAQADRDRGEVENTATTTGTPPKGAPVTDTDEFTQPLAANPGIDIVKTGVLTGDTIAYTFVVTNTGDVTLSGVTVTDPLPGLSAVTFGAWPGQAGVLAPGQKVTATAAYTLTQNDRDNGEVVNTATTGGTPPTGPRVTDQDGFDQPVPTAPGIGLVKVGALDGDTIGYTFTVTNTGNVTLRGVELSDELAGLSDIVFGDWPAATGTLAPGQSVTATASYELTQPDRDRGEVLNTATVTATPPKGDDVTDEDDAEVPVPQAPGIQLVKSGELEGSSIRYSFDVTNVGDVTLRGVTIADELEGLSDIAFGEWPATAGELAPGQSVTATASYALTQADRDAGSVVNVAEATGTPPGGTDVTDDDSAEVPVPQNPSIGLVKTGAQDGALVRFSFAITNTGDVTLHGVALSDDLAGLSAISFGAWPGADGVLAPGQSVTASAVYVVTDADRAAGVVVNVAEATGTPPTGASVTDEADVRVTIVAALAATGFTAERLGSVALFAMLTIALGAAAVVTVRRRSRV
ncbi:DUF7507 domain-containing protein [Microbacterium hatanonis]|uniref:DUF11 domain-containing protein n=1 Tax=Microbacterium hatanonis TaxID=404366 RepID=A0A5C8HWJ6_9MICO|nr:DUF11 domain-containing protein [Microbacterium hatanonis]TXK10347.1 DUF11 domain-containing protein [Microbacterium hatanonis]